jgi:anti-anti-sigma factor
MRTGAMLIRHENLSEVVVEDIVVDMVVVDSERYAVVMLCGEIDCSTAPELQARLLDLAVTAERPLILDMSGVSFCDGSALRAFSATERQCAARGVAMAVIGLRPFLANLFRAFDLHERIPLCAALDEALWRLLPPGDADIHRWLDTAG